MTLLAKVPLEKVCEACKFWKRGLIFHIVGRLFGGCSRDIWNKSFLLISKIASICIIIVITSQITSKLPRCSSRVLTLFAVATETEIDLKSF